MKSLSSLLFLASIALAPAEIDFVHEVVPVLKKHCLECHGGAESKGGLSMNTRALFMEADVMELGSPEDSLLIEVLHEEDPDYRMPPPDEGKAELNKAEIEILERWVAEGAPWEDGITFTDDRYEPPLRPRRVELPEGPAGVNPLDLILGEHFKENGLEFPHPISDREFVRRLSLDFHGVVPTGQFSEKAISGSPFNRDELISTYLKNDQRYAEHWMVFWNDLLRNEYVGTGYIEGGRRQITEWLYKALLENKPYDRFVHELVSPSPKSRGFIKGIKWRGEVNASQTQDIQFSQNISQVFLGINMKCASCHDSFVDRWTLREAYSLAAIIAEQPLELTRCDKPTGEMAKPGWLFPELGNIDPEAPRDERLEQLAGLMTHPENGRMQRTIVNRLWAQLMGRGIVHPVDAMNTAPFNEDLLDYLANYLVDSGYDLKEVLRLIVSSRVYQGQADISREGSDYVFQGPIRKRLTAESFLDSVRTVTNVWPTPPASSFDKGSIRNGQLNAVMKAHNLKEWDDRPVRTVFGKRDQLQATLGRPNREQVVTSRPNLITTLEAISLANGPELSKLLQQAGKKSRSMKQDRAFVDQMFRRSLTRKPTPRELSVALEIVASGKGTSGREDLLWMLFMMPEFHFNN